MLRIKTYILPSNTVIEELDYTIVCNETLTDKTTYLKGRKTETNYFGANGKLIINKTFTDILDEGGSFKGIIIVHNWINEDDTIGLTKTVTKYMGRGVAFDFLRKRRQRTISYLQRASKGTSIEGDVDTLFKWYKEEIELYINNNSLDFQTAINKETHNTIEFLLTKVIDEEGTTVKDSILYQIT